MNWPHTAILSVVGFCAAIAIAQLPWALSQHTSAELIENAARLSESELTEKLKQLTPDKLSALEAREFSQLLTEPFDAKALQNLSVLLAIRNEPTKTQELSLMLARYSLRNVGAQLIAINVLVAKGEFDEAMLRLDAVLRAEPTLREKLFDTLLLLAENKASLPAIAQVLKKEPPWRKAFMTHVAKKDASGQLTYGLLKAVRSVGGAIPNDELRNVLTSWVNSNELERAYFVWLDLLSDEEIKSLKSMYDGQFSREVRNHYFDWNFGTKPNVRIGIARRPGSAVERSLLLDFYGFKGNFSHVSQMWRLSPGTYVASFDHMAQSFKTSGGLRWRVRCVGSPVVIGEGITMSASMPWGNSSFTVNVPQDDCDTQLLRLETASRSSLDTIMQGQIYFDDFKLERKEDESVQ